MRFLWLGLAILFPLTGNASASDPSRLCDEAALQAAEAYDVPVRVMLAITRAETGKAQNGQLRPWPWTVNRAGDGRWFDNMQDAMTFADEEIRNGATNIDIGCFQLNLRWHSENFASLQDMFDPVANADHAARFLVQNFNSKGNWVDAVAAYHSNTPELAKNYVEKVESILTNLSEPQGIGTEQALNPQRVNRFPLLRPGSSATLASLVPAGFGSAPLFAGEP